MAAEFSVRQAGEQEGLAGTSAMNVKKSPVDAKQRDAADRNAERTVIKSLVSPVESWMDEQCVDIVETR